MKHKNKSVFSTILLLALLPLNGLQAAESNGDNTWSTNGLQVESVGEGPFYYTTAEAGDIRVEVIARELNHPWSMTWLPDGSALVTEKNASQVRRIVNDELLKKPVSGVPDGILVSNYTGLLDIALHPDFSNEPYIYMSYNKSLAGDNHAIAVARGRWDGNNIRDTQDIFIGEDGTTNGVRFLFGADDMLYLGVYVTTDNSSSFETGSQKGKILRFTPEGDIPTDNPFVNEEGFLPEIFSYGHRTPTGMTLNQETGEIWVAEMGPNGGDEVNRIEKGGNYGWPLVSLGISYGGGWHSDSFQMEGAQDPALFWMPGISVTGLTFYTGEDFPHWQGDLFVGGMQEGQISGTGQIHRIKFNDNMQEIRRESLLSDLHQRIRDIKQGPDGKLYLLTDEDDGMVLRIEPNK